MVSRFVLKSFPLFVSMCAVTSFAAVSPNAANLDTATTSPTELSAPIGGGGHVGGGAPAGGGSHGGGGGGGGHVGGGGSVGGGGHVGGGGPVGGNNGGHGGGPVGGNNGGHGGGPVGGNNGGHGGGPVGGNNGGHGGGPVGGNNGGHGGGPVGGNNGGHGGGPVGGAHGNGGPAGAGGHVGNNGGAHGGGIGGGHAVGHNGNTVPQGHVDDINHANDRMNGMRGNPGMRGAVDRATGFYGQYRGAFDARGGIYDRFRGLGFPFFRNVWGPEYHFWGFGWRSPYINGFDSYFWNPAFFWFFADDACWDDGYFRTWYGPAYDRFPGFYNRFRRPWVFYPTQAFIDLTMGSSEWEDAKQIEFREALSELTTLLENTLSQELGQTVVLDKGSIEVDHYQLLDNAVVLDGEVQVNGTAYAYKALVDLVNPTASNVVVPVNAQEAPSTLDVQQINTLNAAIVQQGGTLEDVDATQQDSDTDNTDTDPSQQ